MTARKATPVAVAVPQTGETMYYRDYKEPLTPLENGYGYLGVLLVDGAEGKVLCAVCGRLYHALGKHIATHGLSAAGYKEEFGLSQQTALCSEQVRQDRVRFKMRHLATTGELMSFANPTIRAAAQATQRERGTRSRRRGHHLAEEVRNRRGRCFTQIVAVARQVAADGRRPSQKAMAKYGIYDHSLLAVGLTWERLYQLVGARYEGQPKAYTRRELVLSLLSLATKLGRTPTRSDFRRHGLPSTRTYAKVFGSHAAACRAAGLEVAQPARRDDFEVQVMNAYHVLLDVNRVAEQLSCGAVSVRNVLHRYGLPTGQPGPRTSTARVELRAWAAEMAKRLTGEVTTAA